MMVQFLLPHLEYLSEHGYDVEIACSDVGGRMSEIHQKAAPFTKKIHTVRLVRNPFSLKNLTGYQDLKKVICSKQYDIIWTNEPVMGFATRLAAKRTRKNGTKVIYMVHGFHFYSGAPLLNWLLFYPAELFASRFCDEIITINREDFGRAKKMHADSVNMIHGIGVRTDRFHPQPSELCQAVRSRENLAKENFSILCTGELNKNKDQETLITAASILKNALPDLRVFLAGKGAMAEELSALISQLDLQDHVKLLGYRTDLDQLAPAMDLIVSCSHREGLPLNIMEAMLCKKPVVASRNRGHNELVEDGKTGFLFSCGDAEALAARIEELAQDAALSAQMGEAGFQKVQQYTVSAVQAELAKLFSELLEQKSAIKT